MHLFVEINNGVIEVLVDTGSSMSIMVASIIRELGIMHLVFGHETYNTSRNQPKCNHSIYDHMRLIVICD
jgi:hypothetical protein